MTTHQFPLPITLFVLGIEAHTPLVSGQGPCLTLVLCGRRRYG